MRAVILAGGIGSRLWPLSRELYPKQLLSLVNDDSLLQSTISRAVSLGVSQLTVVAAHDHRFYVQEQIDDLSLPDPIAVEILLEPCGRNTAAAIALAALGHPEDILWVMPADHVLSIADLDRKLLLAQLLIEQHYLVTFGIEPGYAETGYGYIQIGASILEGAFQVQAFKEKPDSTVARQYVDQGDFFWNSGMFCFTGQDYLDQLRRYRPDIVTAVEQAHQNQYEDLGFTKFLYADYQQCPSESVDIAVMEQTDCAAIIPLQGQWSDIGSWRALYALQEKDQKGNAVDGDVVLQDTVNSLIKARSKLVAVVGLQNVVVVETEDAVLVADLKNDQAIKSLVQQLKTNQRIESTEPRKVLRPWGHYDILDKTAAYELRRVTLKPQGHIQLHANDLAFKSWQCVVGQARAFIAGEGLILDLQQPLVVPANAEHALCNETEESVIILEVRMMALTKTSLEQN